MGNIKQESNFISNICEGGHRVSYHRCRSGGYGLIQWTSPNRYYGLGRYAKNTGGNPSSIHTQLDYMYLRYKKAKSKFSKKYILTCFLLNWGT